MSTTSRPEDESVSGQHDSLTGSSVAGSDPRTGSGAQTYETGAPGNLGPASGGTEGNDPGHPVAPGNPGQSPQGDPAQPVHPVAPGNPGPPSDDPDTQSLEPGAPGNLGPATGA